MFKNHFTPPCTPPVFFLLLSLSPVLICDSRDKAGWGEGLKPLNFSCFPVTSVVK